MSLHKILIVCICVILLYTYQDTQAFPITAEVADILEISGNFDPTPVEILGVTDTLPNNEAVALTKIKKFRERIKVSEQVIASNPTTPVRYVHSQRRLNNLKTALCLCVLAHYDLFVLRAQLPRLHKCRSL